jgi:hypothetical protein
MTSLWTTIRKMDAEAVAMAVELTHGVKCAVAELGAGYDVTCEVPPATPFGRVDALNAIRSVRDRLTTALEE